MNIPLGPLKLSIQPFKRVEKSGAQNPGSIFWIRWEDGKEHAYGERLLPAGSYDRGPDDGDVEVSTLLLDELFCQGFGERVCVRPLT